MQLIRFDWALKKILRAKANFGILEGFLSELLNEDIKILEILESESNKENADDKFNRVDLLVKNDKDELIIIEIQNSEQVEYFKRILFGVSKTICDFINTGDNYAKVKKVISVSILYFDIGQGKDYLYKGQTEFVGMHQNDRLELSTKQKALYGNTYIHKIFPEYYLLKINQFNDYAKTTLDEWFYFLKHEEVKPDFKAKGLKEAQEKLNIMKMTLEEKKIYDQYIYAYRDEQSFYLNSYVIAKIEGKAEGIIEGERQKALEIAKNLLDILDVETIIKKTGLSKEEIESLY